MNRLDELGAVIRLQGQQTAGSLAREDMIEAGLFLLDALVRVAEALEQIEQRLASVERKLQDTTP